MRFELPSASALMLYRVQTNISALAEIGDDNRCAPLQSADQLFDAAFDALGRDLPPATEHRRLTAAPDTCASSTSLS